MGTAIDGAHARPRDQPQRPVVVLPDVEGGMGQPAPPHRVLAARKPVRMDHHPPDQTVALCFCSGILRLRAGDPLFGPAPARQGVAERAPTQARGGQPLCVGALSGQVQRPRACVLSEDARARVQKGAQRRRPSCIEGTHAAGMVREWARLSFDGAALTTGRSGSHEAR